MKITLIQTQLHWENIDDNLAMLDGKLANLFPTDVVVLPEMFTTGFSMNVSNIWEGMDGKAVKWMQQKAKQLNAAITGSLIIKEGDNFYNRLVWAEPDGKILFYNKKHLFSMAKEHLSFTAGKEKLLLEYKGWKIAPFICYDLRFPAWNRNLEDYDLAIYVANWPARRSYHWRSLLTARAIENQAFIVAVNRVGTDGNGFPYSGDSTVLDPAGALLYHKAEEEDIFTIELSKEHLHEMRRQYPFLGDRDHFIVDN